MLQEQMSPQLIAQLAGQIGGSEQQTANATQGIMSTLIGAMSRNASTQEGASGLFNALQNDHDGSLLDNLSDFINPEKPNPVSERTSNGLGILQHLFGDRTQNISNNIGQQSGLGGQNTLALMAKLAPIVMAMLGKQQRQQNMNINDIAGLLNNNQQRMRQQDSGMSGFMQLLDLDGDGSPIDDAMNLIGKFFSK